MSQKRQKSQYPDTLCLTLLSLCVMGMALVAVIDTTDYRTGQRVVSAAEQRQREPKPVKLLPLVGKPSAEKPSKSARIIALADLTPTCEVHDWSCVLGASGLKFDKQGRTR